LLTNAVKFTTEGVITLAVQQVGEVGTLAVQDSGRGIAPEAAKSIFERFAQVDQANSGRVGGLGLGLWLVKTLVDLHDGRIEVQSAGIGQGATFKVSLPCA
jgi:signal transduction histidine kinase